jgi:transcriptional regulator with XRE-family HTH domain
VTAAEAIRAARLRANLTQTQLAERLGVAQPHVARWESGGVEPTRETLEAVARETGHRLVYRERVVRLVRGPKKGP